ncbi:MAG: glucosamine-6-phosphate deaminase [Acetivibrionales bacterium]|jgi:glucosamine-6-phosphate deaminase
MKIIRAKDYQDMSRKAANIISAQIILKPDSVLGFATGSSPIGIYKELQERYKKGDLDFSRIKTVNLDEYKGLSGDHPQSYRYFMNFYLFDVVNISKENTYVPNGLEEDTEKGSSDYIKIIHSLGGVDLQLLGIGNNGHIGFNEPGTPFGLEVHCADLTDATIEANKRFFDRKEDVPKQAYTMGIKTIMHAKKILLVASGESKADAIAKAITGPITSNLPASILQLHRDVTIIGDEEALSKLNF